MKNIIKTLAGVLFTLLIISSCKQFQDAKDAKEVQSLTAVVKVNLNIGNAPAPASFNVKLINYAERYELNTTVDASGTVSVGNIIPGIYTVTASSEVSYNGFTYNYSGNAVNVDIVTNNKQIKLDVGASKSGALIMKEIFYCGSKTPTGGSYFRDQYYEIYNNSENIQNVKGLSIAILNPLTATAHPCA